MFADTPRRPRSRSTWDSLKIRVRRIFWGAAPDWTRSQQERRAVEDEASAWPSPCYEIE